MISQIIIYIWVLFIVLLLSMAARNVFSHRQKYSFMNFDRVDIPYITINIQGISLNMIVDTGCGISIISAEVLKSLSHTASPRAISLEALTSDSLSSRTVTIPMKIGNKTLQEDFVVYDAKDIANFQANYGIPIHGLLGSEFFDKVKCHIDYYKHTVTFS